MDALRFFGALIRSRDAYRRPVIPLLCAFSAGIICGDHFFLPRLLAGVIIGVCMIGILLAIIRQRTSVFYPLMLFFFLGWFCMTGFAFPKIPAGHVSRFTGKTPWTITGTIIDEAGSAPGRRVFFVKTSWLDYGHRHIRSTGNLRVTVSGADGPALTCGDLVRFQSHIRKITNFKNPGRFDYERYMAFQKVFGHAYTEAERIEVLSDGKAQGWRTIVERMRRNIAGQIEKSGRGVQIGLLKALTLGQRTDLSPEVREKFSRAGVSHLLAISGLHVGIIAGLVFFVLARLLVFIPFLNWRAWVKKSAAVATLPCVLAYGLLAGMSPSTQRAVIMATVFLVALVAGRRHHPTNTLALAALIILAVHPPALFAVSFQLSFAAVFFILAGMKSMADPLNRLENKWIRRGAAFMLVSFSAILGTWPLTAYYFNQAAWAGLFANCLMIPLVGFAAVPLGLGGAALCGLSPGLALIFFKTAGLVLILAYRITEIIAGLPFVAAGTMTPDVFAIGCYYALLWSAILLIKHGGRVFYQEQDNRPVPMSPAVKGAVVIAVIAAVGMAADTGYWVKRRWFHNDLRVTVLDVGQGNAALVELPGGKCLVIDGGGFTGSSTFDTGKMIVAPFLWRNKINRVDTLIMTHPDTDHLGGLLYIADHFHVKNVWSTREPVDTENYRRFIKIVARRHINMPDYAGLEKTRVIDGVRFEILYPPDNFRRCGPSESWRTPNNNSLVTRISLGNVSFLFPGDIMARGERELTIRAGKRLASTVLMSPHHGSRTSSSAFFLSRVKPEIVVVSAGRQNRFNNPSPEVLKRYAAVPADVFRTDLNGAVIMSTNGNSLRVFTPMGEQPRKGIWSVLY